MAFRERPFIAITIGDPAGIGPEITVKALAKDWNWISRRAIPVVIGDANVMAQALQIARSDLPLHILSQLSDAKAEGPVLNLLDMKNVEMDRFVHGKADPMTGKAAYDYIVKAAQLAREGLVRAIVTGPVSKEAINKAGLPFTGHTELLAELLGAKDYAMMLAHGPFRVAHVTTHCSLREACERIKKERVLSVIRLTNETLKHMGVEGAKIAVAGLNPHAGEEGLFGEEDRREIAPAVVEARAEGIDVEGPIPPDTIFPKLKGRLYDAVVVMYHDQGHIPVKLLGFSVKKKGMDWSQMGGINLMMGLPVIRTSVDHGVAFGKAGQGRANPESMRDAIKMAIRLLSKKSHPKRTGFSG